VLLATAGRIDIEQGEGFGLDVGEEPGQLFGRQRQRVLMSLNSETVEHGETLHVEGAAMPQGFRVVSKSGPLIAAAATLTSNTLWTQAMLEQATVVDAQRGGIRPRTPRPTARHSSGRPGRKVKNMATAILTWLLPGRAGKRSSPFWRNTPISEISLADHLGVNG
jgi:hypothetical protein